MERTATQKERTKGLLRERRRVEAELVAQGKKPYFLKKNDVRQLELVDRLKQAKERSSNGQVNVDKLTEKHRKHKASKQRKALPPKK